MVEEPEKAKSPRQLAQQALESHKHIGGDMNSLIMDMARQRMPKMKRDKEKPLEFEIPFEKLEKANAPPEVINHLRHADIEKFKQMSDERKVITDEINAAFRKIEEDPEANKEQVIRILNLFKDAENHVISTHVTDKDTKEGNIYQRVYDRIDTVLQAIRILEDNRTLKWSQHLKQAKEKLGEMREYCRGAKERHALWLVKRPELKGLVAELGESLDVTIEPKLLEIPDVNDVYYSIEGRTNRNLRNAMNLIGKS